MTTKKRIMRNVIFLILAIIIGGAIGFFAARIEHVSWPSFLNVGLLQNIGRVCLTILYPLTFYLIYQANKYHLSMEKEEDEDKEYELFHKCNGGRIQYVRLDNPNNFNAVKTLIERGMSMGFYQGVNFDAAYCEDCGRHSTNIGNTCPHCGSHNLSVISRVCGYLGYSNVNGKSRMNDAKMAEIKDRKSM